jgi:hypothetical protein
VQARKVGRSDQSPCGIIRVGQRLVVMGIRCAKMALRTTAFRDLQP